MVDPGGPGTGRRAIDRRRRLEFLYIGVENVRMYCDESVGKDVNLCVDGRQPDSAEGLPGWIEGRESLDPIDPDAWNLT